MQYLSHACDDMRYQGFAIMTFGTFLDTTGMVKAAVRRDGLLGSSPCLTFSLGWKGRRRRRGDTTNRETDKFVGLPVLLSVGLLLAPYVWTLI